MNDDYLWDRSGPPDPEIRELEEVLAPLRHRAVRVHRRRRWAIAAAAVLVGVGAFFFFAKDVSPPEPRVVWSVDWLQGPGRARALAAGEWLETGAQDRARIEVADIGHVDVAARSRIRLVGSGPEEHRMELARGKLSALVYAPPRLFVVDTPAGSAVDLGCAYTLEVDDEGVSVLDVTAGYVQLEARDHLDAYVPSGATCRMRPGAGAGLPWFRDAPQSLRDLDASNEMLVDLALKVSRERDTLTLWHLLQRVPETGRGAVLDRMIRLVPLPAEISRADVERLDAAALLRWRTAMEGFWY